ncbi:hypothetical protein [Dyadobacter crusticola]|uniref:hypothetical protein n=1 Tax=Dyadobacter crusticola TaxID=292407 RepID=UPI0004E19247|nr:hypothetical protein [Dyadobacter crusticola]
MKLLKRFPKYVLALWLFAACLPQLAIPENSWGYFSARVNGKRWEKTFENAFQAIRASEHDLDSSVCKRLIVYSLLFESDGNLQEELSFSNIPKKEGRYKVSRNRTYSCKDSTTVYSHLNTFIDFDMFRDQYEVLDSEDNYLQIDTYQENGNREIKGRFNVTYVLKTPRAFNSYEDTLRFTNGKFHTKILEPLKRHL